MLIMCQNRKSLLNLDTVGEIYLSSAYGDYKEGEPVKIYASFPNDEDVCVTLGTYESEKRAVEVLERIFAYAIPKAYFMPDK